MQESSQISHSKVSPDEQDDVGTPCPPPRSSKKGPSPRTWFERLCSFFSTCRSVMGFLRDAALTVMASLILMRLPALKRMMASRTGTSGLVGSAAASVKQAASTLRDSNYSSLLELYGPAKDRELAKPIVLHTDNIEMEGEDGELKEVCRWQTLLGGEGGQSEKLTVGLATVFPGCPPSSHAHSHDELYYLIEGGGITQVSGVDYNTPEGTMIFIPGGQTHGFRNTGTTNARLLYAFAADSFGEIEYDHSGKPVDAPESRDLKPVIVNVSQCPREGTDTAFPVGCHWKTVLSSDRMPTAKLTMCLTTIEPEHDQRPHIDMYRGLHSHVNPEMYYVMEGTGIVVLDHLQQEVSKGSVVYIPGSATHNIINTGTTPLVFLDVLAADSLSSINFIFRVPKLANTTNPMMIQRL